MSLFSKLKVAVLRGGPSHEYETSLKTGGHILSVLREMPRTYNPVDIFISKEGEWHNSGLVETPHRALRRVDLVWNALHGPYGEDGQVQKILEGMRIPFIGSGTAGSVLSMNKEVAKSLYAQHFLDTPAHELITEENFNEDKLIDIFRMYMTPIIVKPSNGAGGLGILKARTYPELKEAIKETFNHSPRVLVEEFIEGRDVSCAVIDKTRRENIYALMPSNVGKFKLDARETNEIERMAKKAHEALGLRHYSESDFIVTPKNKVYILETNSSPALHEGSLMHTSLGAAGWHSRDFVEHCIKLVME